MSKVKDNVNLKENTDGLRQQLKYIADNSKEIIDAEYADHAKNVGLKFKRDIIESGSLSEKISSLLQDIAKEGKYNYTLFFNIDICYGNTFYITINSNNKINILVPKVYIRPSINFELRDINIVLDKIIEEWLDNNKLSDLLALRLPPSDECIMHPVCWN